LGRVYSVNNKLLLCIVRKMYKTLCLCVVLVLVIHSTSGCHPNWYNLCKKGSDCCSGTCYLGSDGRWLDGICHPQGYVQPRKCHPNWYNLCKTGSDCCSGTCYLGSDGGWLDGVCHPQGYVLPRSCHPNWYNKCKSGSDCCSESCYRGRNGGWVEGVCHPQGYKLPQSNTKLGKEELSSVSGEQSVPSQSNTKLGKEELSTESGEQSVPSQSNTKHEPQSKEELDDHEFSKSEGEKQPITTVDVHVLVESNVNDV